MAKEILLRLEDISKTYRKKSFLGKERRIEALQDVSLTLYKGETLGLVGESGSGKSTLSKILLGLETASAGAISYDGLTDTDLRRQALQVIYQDPYSSLNPHLSALELVKEPLFRLPKSEAEERALAMLERVGIKGQDVHKRPRAFSGGQRQRIGIARAVVANPQFVVCDEPTSALDVSIQATILKLLSDLQQEFALSYLFISHDLNVVRKFANRIAVMYQGRLVEVAPAAAIFENPHHPYTRYLLAANLSLDPLQARRELQEATHAQLDFEFSTEAEWVEVAPNHFVRKEVGEV
ncbi:TPA: ABC transporter ATP-binding protein [Streptococcus suis]|nr:ABC transporter ATP-binding protein [Streptococcus suis]